MADIKPTHVRINGVDYALELSAESFFEEWVESDILADSKIEGASRPAVQPRSEIRAWKIDDWSAGEGYKFLDSRNDHPSQRGYLYATNSAPGDGVIDVSVPGEVSLGLDKTVSHNPGIGAGSGPYFAVAGNNVWIAHGSLTYEQTALDTWTARTNGMNGQQINGPVSGHMSGVFIAGVRSGADGGVRRVTAAGNTSWVAESARSALVADNRVYYATIGATTSLLKRVGLDAAAAGTTMITFNGIGTTYAGAVLCAAAVGSRIYVLVGNLLEAPRLWVLENDVGREVAVFDGLRLPTTSEEGIRLMTVVNGVVYVGGYEKDIANNKVPRLDFYDGQTWGTAFRLTARTGLQIRSVSAGRQNEVLCTVGSSYNRLLRYDTTTGGVSQFAVGAAGSAPEPRDATFHEGVYYIGSTDGTSPSVVRTLTSGSGKYLSSQTIAEPTWDYDLPDTEKMLVEIEVHTADLPSGASVEVQVILDGTTTVTTDAAGATMSHVSGSRKLFTLSGASAERTFRFLQPIILLKTSNTANTPTLYSVTIRCLPIPSKLRLFECLIACKDETATDRKTGQQLNGRQIRANLETLRDSTSDRVFTFIPYIKGAGPPYEGPKETSHTVMLQPGVRNGGFSATKQGEGVMRCRFLKLG